MNKRILNKIRKIFINANRLNDNRELYPIEWLLSNNHGTCGSYENNLGRIKSCILYMDKGFYTNYQHLSFQDKEKVENLIQHEDIVDMVLLILFQWFGTSVGKNNIGKLLDEN